MNSAIINIAAIDGCIACCIVSVIIVYFVSIALFSIIMLEKVQMKSTARNLRAFDTENNKSIEHLKNGNETS